MSPVHPTLADLPVQTDADVLGTGFTLQLGDTTDTFLISDDGLAEMAAADIRFVGEYLFLRRDPSDTDFRFVMLNGRFLQVGSQVLVDLWRNRAMHYVRNVNKGYLCSIDLLVCASYRSITPV